MISIDEDQETIHLTRGDETNEFSHIAFYFPIYENGEITNYKFKPTDKISFIVKEKKGYTKIEVFRVEKTLKEMGYTEETEYPEITLDSALTKKFKLTNKKKTYWYDLVLNDTTTIIGYDEEGAKKIIVYPEGEGD